MMAEDAITVEAVLPQGAPISAASRQATIRRSARTTTLLVVTRSRTVVAHGRRQDVLRLRMLRHRMPRQRMAASNLTAEALLMVVELRTAVGHLTVVENTSS